MAITNNLNLFDIVDTGSTGVYFSGGGGSPSLDSDIVIAGNSAFGRRVTDTTAPGIGVGALAGTAVDLTNSVVGTWVWVTQRGVLANGGVVYSSQTAKNQIQNNYRISNYSAATDYPPEGGWLRLWYEPDSFFYTGPFTSGTIDFTNINFIGHTAYFTATPGGNSPNVWVDRIDFTKSSEAALIITGSESFSSIAATDANGTNEWGIFRERGGIYNQYGPIQYGTAASSVTLQQDGDTVAFVQSGLVPTGFLRNEYNIENASSTVDFKNVTFLGTLGFGSARSPDFTVSGSSGSFSATTCTMAAHRNITFTPACTITGGIVEGQRLIQDGATISGGANLRHRGNILNAYIDDPDFSKLTDVTFTLVSQSGAAIALTSGSSFTFTDILFEGYASGSGQASAVFNNTGNNIEITLAGTTQPFSVRNATGLTTTLLGAPRNFELTGLKDGTEVRLINADTNVEIAGVETVASGSAVGGVINNGGGTVTIGGSADNNTFNYAYQFSQSTDILAAILSASAFEVIYLESSLQNSDKSIPIQQQPDRNYNNPPG